MRLSGFYQITAAVALGEIILVLAVSVSLSVLLPGASRMMHIPGPIPNEMALGKDISERGFRRREVMSKRRGEPFIVKLYYF